MSKQAFFRIYILDLSLEWGPEIMEAVNVLCCLKKVVFPISPPQKKGFGNGVRTTKSRKP